MRKVVKAAGARGLPQSMCICRILTYQIGLIERFRTRCLQNAESFPPDDCQGQYGGQFFVLFAGNDMQRAIVFSYRTPSDMEPVIAGKRTLSVQGVELPPFVSQHFHLRRRCQDAIVKHNDLY